MSESVRLLVRADPLWTSSSVFDASRFVLSTFCIEACRDSSIRHALDVLDDRGSETRPTSPERSLSQEKLSSSRSGTTHTSGSGSPRVECCRPKQGSAKLLIVRRVCEHSNTHSSTLLVCDTVTPLLYRCHNSTGQDRPGRARRRPGLAWADLRFDEDQTNFDQMSQFEGICEPSSSSTALCSRRLPGSPGSV